MRIHKKLLFVAALTALASASLWAADDPFVGTWKLNRDKSQIAGQVQQIKDLGGNKYDWVYGDNHLEIIADGTDHPIKFGGTVSVDRQAPGRWVVTRKHDGQVTNVDIWTLSDSGKQWDSETKGTRPDGSSFTVNRTCTRVGAGSGFAGTWELQNAQYSSTAEWVIKPYGNDGLSFAFPADKEHQEMKFDGKDYPDHGPRVAPDSMSSAKRIDEYTIQMTDKLHGKVTDTQQLKVSEDGRTLTATTHVGGEQKPIIAVFEKQM